jgi:hypothetical protein
MNEEESERDAIIDQFISESINTELIYTSTKNGEVQCWSRDESEKSSIIVFTKEEDAKKNIEDHSDDLEVTTIPLFDFLYLWLPDMFDRLFLAGISRNGLIFEFEPEEVQARYTELMPELLESQYEEKRSNNPEYSYVCIGSFPNSDAKALLKEFEEKGIRYDDGIDSSQIKGMDVGQAVWGGGTFGCGAHVTITVHEEDLELADELQRKVFEPDS